MENNKDIYWVNVCDVTQYCVRKLELVSLVNTDPNKAPG